MRYKTLAAAFVLNVAAAGVLHAQVATPEACMDSIRTHIRSAYREAQLAHQAPDQAALRRSAADEARACAQQFAGTPSNSSAFLGALAELYLIAEDTAQARRTFAQVIDAPGISDSERVVDIVSVTQAWQAFTGPSIAAGEVESLMHRMDRIPGLPAMRLEAHASLIPGYEDFDEDPHIRDQVRAIQALVPQLSPDERLAHAKAITAAYLSQAKLQANALHVDSALATLGVVSHLLPGVADSLGVERDRRMYELVGKQAPAIHADYWVNGPAGPLRGTSPTVLMFTGEWCHSCREAYPTIGDLLKHYGPRGLHWVFAIELTGYFKGHSVSADQEVADNRQYYVDQEHFKAPIAIQRGPDEPPPSDVANTKAYVLHFWPMFVVIDRNGVIRGILQGWDPYGSRAAMLKRLIEGNLG